LNGNNAIWDTSRDRGRHLDWLSKAVRAVPYDAKFTGTAAHGKGGVFIFMPKLKRRKPVNGVSDLSTSGAKLFSKILLENFRKRDDN